MKYISVDKRLKEFASAKEALEDYLSEGGTRELTNISNYLIEMTLALPANKIKNALEQFGYKEYVDLV